MTKGALRADRASDQCRPALRRVPRISRVHLRGVFSALPRPAHTPFRYSGLLLRPEAQRERLRTAVLLLPGLQPRSWTRGFARSRGLSLRRSGQRPGVELGPRTAILFFRSYSVLPATPARAAAIQAQARSRRSGP